MRPRRKRRDAIAPPVRPCLVERAFTEAPPSKADNSSSSSLLVQALPALGGSVRRRCSRLARVSRALEATNKARMIRGLLNGLSSERTSPVSGSTPSASDSTIFFASRGVMTCPPVCQRLAAQPWRQAELKSIASSSGLGHGQQHQELPRCAHLLVRFLNCRHRTPYCRTHWRRTHLDVPAFLA